MPSMSFYCMDNEYSVIWAIYESVKTVGIKYVDGSEKQVKMQWKVLPWFQCENYAIYALSKSNGFDCFLGSGHHDNICIQHEEFKVHINHGFDLENVLK